MITRDDKRDFIRMQIEAPIQVQWQANGTQYECSGVCHDLSATGLSFSLPFEQGSGIQKGDALYVTITGGHSLPPLQAQVTVIRSEQGEQGNWDIGAQITQIE
ncbi:PilZ domain-containing protein [Aliidiomarina celeris]|uniref:PilZ domain-containing protein n=1 Tax=Aliidiomarina celeris TaxID=2249428 RepID=UPI000DEA755C|nr:PilZ domain-containing protein [Aliidiomarina celeris]